MSSIRRLPPFGTPFAWLLAAGLGFRLVLAYVVFPGSGYAGDLGLFESWATTLARVGPGGFYAAASSANYPPGCVAPPLRALRGRRAAWAHARSARPEAPEAVQSSRP